LNAISAPLIHENLAMPDSWLPQLDRSGYVVLPGVFSPAEITALLANCEEMLRANAASDSLLAGNDGAAYGARNVLRSWPNLGAVLHNPKFHGCLVAALGLDCGAVRGLYFDKPPGHSWALPWHRDQTIAVQSHAPDGEFRKPTFKAGVPHVEASAAVLETMLTARIHLDQMTAQNGPLRVAPGSHRIKETPNEPVVTLTCAAGDVLLMRPLLLHASGHSEKGHECHRRILHLEFARSERLPPPFRWHDFIPVAQSMELRSRPTVRTK
jgi:hypothetical protein